MFELNGKQIRVGRAMFPPSQIINDGPETHFERSSAAMVSALSLCSGRNIHLRRLSITPTMMASHKRLCRRQEWRFRG